MQSHFRVGSGEGLLVIRVSRRHGCFLSPRRGKERHVLNRFREVREAEKGIIRIIGVRDLAIADLTGGW